MTKARTGRPRGRPSKLTPEVSKALVEALETGATQVAACNYAGISVDTVTGWLAAATVEGAKAEFLEFADAYARATARRQVFHLNNIKVHARHDWRASAWVLERTDPDDFGRRTVIQHANADGSSGLRVDMHHSGAIAGVKLDPASLAKLTDEESDALERALVKLADTGGE
jgi:hypothetical protein